MLGKTGRAEEEKIGGRVCGLSGIAAKEEGMGEGDCPEISTTFPSRRHRILDRPNIARISGGVEWSIIGAGCRNGQRSSYEHSTACSAVYGSGKSAVQHDTSHV